MKKIFMIGAVVAAAVIALGATGLVYAQTQTPPNPEAPYGGYGFRAGGRGPGMMGGGFGGFQGRTSDGTYGPMHEYMIDALAEAFDLTPAEIEAAHQDGKTLFDLAAENGFSVESFRDLMIEARSNALNQAATDGVISQEQAEWMQSRANRMWAGGYGPGSGTCNGQGPHGGMRGGWNNQ